MREMRDCTKLRRDWRGSSLKQREYRDVNSVQMKAGEMAHEASIPSCAIPSRGKSVCNVDFAINDHNIIITE